MSFVILFWSQLNLFHSATGVFVQGRVLGILAGQALGANRPKMIGKWLQVSYVVLSIVTVPVIVLWLLTKPVLSIFSFAPSLVSKAALYAAILSIALPLRVVFSQMSQTLSAQKVFEQYFCGVSLLFLFNKISFYIYLFQFKIKTKTKQKNQKQN